MRTGIKLLIMLFIFLAAGYIEVHAAVPVLKDSKKIKFSMLDETLSRVTGLAITSTDDGSITWED